MIALVVVGVVMGCSVFIIIHCWAFCALLASCSVQSNGDGVSKRLLIYIYFPIQSSGQIFFHSDTKLA